MSIASNPRLSQISGNNPACKIDNLKDNHIAYEKGPIECGVVEISSEAAGESVEVDEAKLLRKIDLHVIPGVTILYLLSFIDRGNIGNAKIEGLPQELNLKGNQWNIVLTVFYFTYCAFEVPYNILIAKFRPSIILPTTMVIWGVVVTLTGLVKNYHQLIVVRVLLGAAEGGLYPGVVFYLTRWYPRRHLQYRQALFFAAASGAGAFSGLLAYGIGFMNGVGGLSGWRWIFIIEGMLTVVVAFLIYFIINDYPDTAKFLSEEEREFVLHSLSHDYDSRLNVSPEVMEEAHNKRDRSEIKKAFFDWQLPCHVFVHWSFITTLYTVSFFLPSIVKSLGYTRANAQLMTIPPYAFSVVSSIVTSYYSDKVGLRSPFILFYQIVMMVGYIMATVIDPKKNPGGVYAGMFLAVVGTYSAFPGMISWLALNVSGPYKRSISVALHVGFGNMGSTFATNYFRTKDAPRYTLGYGMSILFVGMGMVSLLFINYRYYILNKRKEKAIAEGITETISEAELLAMGDRSPFFKYQH